MSKLSLRSGHVWFKRALLLAMLCLTVVPAWQVGRGIGAHAVYGPYGPEGRRLREQLWIVPGGDPKVALRATVFRPTEDGGARRGKANTPRPLVVINHGSDETTREAVSMPVFYWLSKWFVDRGYVVVLPQRRGHGATGGDLAEGRDTCANPDHYAAGLAAADDIEAVLRYMAEQPFINPSRMVVAGVSTGGWASLALASRNPAGVELIVNFAGGRGGHAYGEPNAVCGRDRLIEAAGAYARGARVPTLWIYADNDSYFDPELAGAMASAWRSGGGRAELRVVPAHGDEGHDLVSDRAGWRLWGRELERTLVRLAEKGPVRTSQAR
jgi:dienelactone hydrolase